MRVVDEKYMTHVEINNLYSNRREDDVVEALIEMWRQKKIMALHVFVFEGEEMKQHVRAPEPLIAEPFSEVVFAIERSEYLSVNGEIYAVLKSESPTRVASVTSSNPKAVWHNECVRIEEIRPPNRLLSDESKMRYTATFYSDGYRVDCAIYPEVLKTLGYPLDHFRWQIRAVEFDAYLEFNDNELKVVRAELPLAEK